MAPALGARGNAWLAWGQQWCLACVALCPAPGRTSLHDSQSFHPPTLVSMHWHLPHRRSCVGDSRDASLVASPCQKHGCACGRATSRHSLPARTRRQCRLAYEACSFCRVACCTRYLSYGQRYGSAASLRCSRGLWQGGILAIDTSADVAATAGADGSVVLFDRAAGRVRAHLSAHAKRVTGARPKG